MLLLTRVLKNGVQWCLYVLIEKSSSKKCYQNGICHCGLVGKTLVQELSGCGIKPKYRQIHSGLDDHLKLAVICHWVLSPVAG